MMLCAEYLSDDNVDNFKTWEEEFRHIGMSKDVTLVQTLKDQHGIDFMKLRAVHPKSSVRDPGYYEFQYDTKHIRFDPITKEWKILGDNFTNWAEQHEHLELSKDLEMVELLRDTFGYSFVDDIRAYGDSEFKVIREPQVRLRYRNKEWTRRVVTDTTRAVRHPTFLKSVRYGNRCYSTSPCQHYVYKDYEDGTTENVGLLYGDSICELLNKNGFEIPEHFMAYSNPQEYS